MGTHHILPGLGREVNLFVCLFSCEDQTICFPKKCFTSVCHHKLEWCYKKYVFWNSEFLSIVRNNLSKKIARDMAFWNSYFSILNSLISCWILRLGISATQEKLVWDSEIYDFSFFTFDSACDLKFYTGYLDNRVDSNCKFKKWWRHWHIFLLFYSPESRCWADYRSWVGDAWSGTGRTGTDSAMPPGALRGSCLPSHQSHVWGKSRERPRECVHSSWKLAMFRVTSSFVVNEPTRDLLVPCTQSGLFKLRLAH